MELITRQAILFLIISLPFFGFSQGNYDTNSVMVRFNHQLLNSDKLDNWDLSYFTFEKMLTDEGENELYELGTGLFNIGYLECRKIFPNLKSYNTVSFGRQGQEVSIPPFWATFSVNKPTNVSFLDFTRTLKSAYPVVIYVDPKFEVELLSVPNDSMYVQQQSLAGTTYPDAHINAEAAWEVETGVPWIKVGVFDTGIDTTNEDLEILTGWAWNSNLPSVWGTDTRNHGTKSAGVIGARRNDSIGIAGITGGNGSDSTGVSLIDFRYNQGGGNVSNIEQLSVGIINAARSVGTYYDWGQNQILDNYSALQVGYGIHIGNHSYAVSVDAANKQEDEPLSDTIGGGGTYTVGGEFIECNLCRESFLFSLQNGVVNVVSRGNKLYLPPNLPDPNTYNDLAKYPYAYDDSWIISVGSSGTDGNRLLPGGNATDYYFHPRGRSIDVIAPGTVDLNWTTSSIQDSSSNNPNPQPYGKYNGTSSAAPHVSGVAALLLSHYNDTCYSEMNLDPADVEYVIQKSAKTTIDNTFTDPYSLVAGWGRLDAEKALDMIDFPEYQIIHPTTNFISSQIVEQDTVSLFIDTPLNQDYGGPLGSSFPLELELNYETVRYKYSLSYNFSPFLGDSAELLDIWVRHSRTNSLRKTEDTYDSLVPISPGNSQMMLETFSNTFEIEPMCEIDSVVGDSSIFLSGYYYHFIGKYGSGLTFGVTDSENFWYPIDPNNETPQMAYSIYVRDSTIAARYPFTCDSLNLLFDSTAYINDILQDNSFDWTLYPNPSNSNITVSLNDEALLKSIIITDVSGKEINKTLFTGVKIYTIDISQFGNGLYFVNLIDYHGNFLESKKLMKL